MYTWSLNDLYEGYNEKFTNDFNKLEQGVETLTKLASQLKTVEDLEHWLNEESSFSSLLRTQFAFVNLNISTNATDPESFKHYGALQNLISKVSKPDAQFKTFLIKHKEDLMKWCETSTLVKEHEFVLNEIVKQAKHNLNDDVEEALALMKINASSAWDQLQSHLTSVSTIEYKEEQHTLTSLRNFAYDSNQAIRKGAYEKELELCKKIEDSVAFALNSIKGEVNQVSNLREYTSPIERTLQDSRMSRKTLDALMGAIETYTPHFRRYLQHKGKLLGHENGLPWYDLFAPFEVENPKTYSVEESKDVIVNSFANFSKDLSDLALRAYDENWIDFLPREGKRGGAFCMNLPQIKQSRVLTNFDGSTSGLVTLAHELGHAYHGKKIEHLSILNTSYSMPVAETASTFCENIVFNATLKNASKEEQLVLIENSISDLTQIIVDINSRYKFESEVLRRRENEFLFAKDLSDIMIQAQKDTYGDGLDQDNLHSHMWLVKGHYYSAGLSFYNFPYAFGGLFALGLYAKFEAEGEAFVPQYEALLSATTTASCEDVAKMANIDVEDQAFWESSLEVAVKRIDQFIELTKI